MKSTVDLLHEHLDRTPDDHDLRLVLADALDEEGSELAAGYRAISRCKKWTKGVYGCYWFDNARTINWGGKLYPLTTDHNELPQDWYDCLDEKDKDSYEDWRAEYRTRRIADDALAQAFTRLPPDRQQQLLDGVLTTDTD